MEELVKKLVSLGVLVSPQIISAFLACDRKEFVLPEYQGEAYVDAPLPIGSGQTVSQPYTVAFMVELLQPKAGQKILDIGFGSGWTTAILAEIAGPKGRVYGVEIVPELYEFGKRNLQKFAYENLELLNQSGTHGLPAVAPFDRILVSAASPSLPKALPEQLCLGGKLVIPIGPGYSCAIKSLKKIEQNKFQEEEYPGFAFVPLVNPSIRE